jgi:polygalacturonase
VFNPLVRRRDFLKQAARFALAAPAAFVDPTAFAQPSDQTASGPSGAQPASAGLTLNVRDFGTAADGRTKDTLALQQAIERCAFLGGGRVRVPAGQYLIGTLALLSHVELALETGAVLLGSSDLADYPKAQVRWEGRWIRGYSGLITAIDGDEIAMTGPGKIIASQTIRGRVEHGTGLRLPALIELTGCRNVRVEDCFTSQAGMWSIHPTYCENVSFKNLVVDSGADGIDVDSSRHVVIDGCQFETGDDCISLKSGRGEEGYTISRPTEDVRISNCTFNDSYFACIGIGSETSGGIGGVHIERCKCLGARTYAIYIKTRPGRGAFIEDLFIDGFEAAGAKQGFLRINSLNSGKQDEFPVPGDEGLPTLANFRFSNIHVDGTPVLVDASEVDPRKPLIGFSLSHVAGTCSSGITLTNMKKAVLSDIRVTGYAGPLIQIENVSGSGLAGAQKMDPAKRPNLPAPIPAPATPYRLD